MDGDPIGRRVLVRLGKQKVTGYVLALLPEEDVSYRILPVLRFLDEKIKGCFLLIWYHFSDGLLIIIIIP